MPGKHSHVVTALLNGVRAKAIILLSVMLILFAARPVAALRWDFSASTEGWTARGSNTNVRWSGDGGGRLYMDTYGSDPGSEHDPNAYGNTHVQADLDLHLHPNTHEHGHHDAHSDPDVNAHRFADIDADLHSDSDFHDDYNSNAHANLDQHGDAHAERYSDGDTHADSHGHANLHPHALPNWHAAILSGGAASAYAMESMCAAERVHASPARRAPMAKCDASSSIAVALALRPRGRRRAPRLRHVR